MLFPLFFFCQNVLLFLPIVNLVVRILGKLSCWLCVSCATVIVLLHFIASVKDSEKLFFLSFSNLNEKIISPSFNFVIISLSKSCTSPDKFFRLSPPKNIQKHPHDKGRGAAAGD